jgi:hypothetical protein
MRYWKSGGGKRLYAKSSKLLQRLKALKFLIVTDV